MRFKLPQRRRTRQLLVASVLLLIVGMWGARPALVNYEIWRGRSALDSRDVKSAIVYFQQAEKFDPNRAETHFLLSRAYRKLGRLERVRHHIDRARQLGYDVDKLRREQWLALAQAGQLAEAEPHLEQLLIDVGNDGAEICEAFVSGFDLNHRIEEALQWTVPWIADYPNDPQPHVRQGKIHAVTQRHKQAERDFRRALELDPDFSDAAYELGEVLLTSNNPQSALQFFQRCRSGRIDTEKRLLAQIGEAQCLKRLGDSNRAYESLAEVLKANPDHPKALLEMGRLQTERGLHKDGLRYLRLAFGRNSGDVEVRYALAIALRGTGKIEEARSHFEYATKARRALLQASQLRIEVAKNPSNVEARSKIGKIYLEYGLPESGIVWLQSVLNYQPHHRATLQALAEYYEKRAAENPDFAKLAKQYRRTAESVPADKSGA